MPYRQVIAGFVQTGGSGGGGGSQSLAQVLAVGNDANSLNIKNLLDPVDTQDAMTLNYWNNNTPPLAQTPWISNIDGAGFSLSNINSLFTNKTTLDDGFGNLILNASNATFKIGNTGSVDNIFLLSTSNYTILDLVYATTKAGLFSFFNDSGSTGYCGVREDIFVNPTFVFGNDSGLVTFDTITQIFSIPSALKSDNGFIFTDGSGNLTATSFIGDGSLLTGLTISQFGVSPIADGTYTVGLGVTNNGTITTQNGIITAVQEAS